ncbi:ComF family protein [Fictibacillus barbaricus]|uniref:Competence protein ComFC n=1 Tax=Fictibacillus barbaricus TaxID=182136 RepID=A0ABU1U111_9BACL|nr:ComF family protein [Fictibacillus barbaricus]MDR7073159.1 competence protein ComFC [Fictibacillus barbaricus]
MSYCLFCHQSYSETWSWAMLLGVYRQPILCQPCIEMLKLIKGDICRICGRSFSLFPEEYRQADLCSDCVRWEEDEEWCGVLLKNRSLYVYNDFLKELVSKLKYRGDAEIVKAFHVPAKALAKTFYRKQIVVPIPLSDERQYERGFNQAELLATGFSSKVQLLLKRTNHEEKQSKKNRQDRLKKKANPFELIEGSSVKELDILLVDDVYTTGSTLRYAAKVLVDAGANSVSSFTLAR